MGPPLHLLTMNIFSPWSWGQEHCFYGEGLSFEPERGVEPLNFSVGDQNFSSSEPGATQVMSKPQAIKTRGHLAGWARDAGLGDTGVCTSSQSLLVG